MLLIELRKALLIFCAALAAVTFPASVSAETRYISDQLTAYFRKGPGSSFGIKKGVRSGAKVTLTGTKTADGWLEVKASDGVTGWVPRSVLKTKPAARVELVGLKATLKKVKAENATLRKQRDQARSQGRNLQTEQGDLQRAHNELQRKYKEVQRISAGTVEINQRNDRLEDELATIQDENDRLKSQNKQLRSNENQQWFVFGAGVIILGMLIGLILPKLRLGKRKDAWSDL